MAFSSGHFFILGFLLLIQILDVLLILFPASRGRWCDSGRLEAPTQALQSHPRPTNAPAVEHKDNLPILSMLYQLCYDSASFPLLRCNMFLFEKYIPSPTPPPPLPILSWIKYSLCLYYHSSLLPFFFVSFCKIFCLLPPLALASKPCLRLSKDTVVITWFWARAPPCACVCASDISKVSRSCETGKRIFVSSQISAGVTTTVQCGQGPRCLGT